MNMVYLFVYTELHQCLSKLLIFPINILHVFSFLDFNTDDYKFAFKWLNGTIVFYHMSYIFVLIENCNQDFVYLFNHRAKLSYSYVLDSFYFLCRQSCHITYE